MKKRLILCLVIMTMTGNSILAQDSWMQKSNFGGGKRYGTIHFSIGSKGYVGTGSDDVTIKSDFWEYDPASNVWTQKADFGGGIRYLGTGFSIGNKGYAGTGIVASYDWRKDMWEYNPATNSWRQVADFAGGLRYTAVGFCIGNKGYMGTGNYRISPAYPATYYNDFWEFDPSAGAAGTWTRKRDVPEQGRTNAIGISIGNKGYIGTGVYYYDTRKKDFWEYDPVTDIWTRKADLPGIERYAATAFTIGNKGYIGTGAYYSNYNDLWEYNQVTDSWSQKTNFPGVERNTCVAFSIGYKGYLGLGGNNCCAQNDFYEYNPYTVTLTCPANKTIFTGSNSCNAVVFNIDPIVTVIPAEFTPTVNYNLIYNGQNAGSGTGSASGQTFQKGTTTVNYSLPEYPNQNCSFTVTVVDNVAPVINCPPEQFFCFNAGNNYTIPQLTATDNCGIQSISYAITGATTRSGSGANASGIFSEGTSTIQWTVRDSSGNTRICLTTVNINPKLNVWFPDAYSAVGGRPNTIYIGYGFYIYGFGFYALLLAPVPSGGTPFRGPLNIPYYHYKWSNGSTLPTIVISPPVGTYVYSVTVTDAVGCEVTVQKSIRVIDVKCKVFRFLPGVKICRPGNKQKCVLPGQVPIELLFNAEIGSCNASSMQSGNEQQGVINQESIFKNASAENGWTRKADLNGEGRYGATGFSIGKKGYLGLGSGMDYPYKDFWEYDPDANAWTQKADFAGTARSLATGFSIASKGYIGTGVDNDDIRNDFWEYDPTLNIWSRKADFAGDARVYGTGFNIGNKGYIGTGYDNNGEYRKDFWEYNPSTNNWMQKADFGGTARYLASGFSIGSRGYIGTGIDIERLENDFWEYDPSADNWTRKADFAGTPRFMATGFGINTRGYIGTGYDSTNNSKNDFWEYDPTADTWMQKADFAGGERLNATGFSIDGKGYLGTGSNYSGLSNDIWEYTPDCHFVTENNTPYIIYANKEARFGEYNHINGDVGVTASNGQANFKKYDTLNPYKVYAADVSVQTPSYVTNVFTVPATGGPNPGFQNYVANPLSGNYTATTNGHIPVGNFANLTIKKGIISTANGSDYGKITIEEGAEVTFTSPVINLEELQMHNGKKNDNTTNLYFSNAVSLRIKNKVSIGNDCRVNAAGQNVTFYFSDNSPDVEKCNVKGDNTQVTSNFIIPNGKLKVDGGNASTCIMTGWYVIEKLESTGKFITWNKNDCSTPTTNRTFINTSANQTPLKASEKIKIIDGFSVKAYPNPSSNDFNIVVKCKSDEPVTVRILDINGKLRHISSGIPKNNIITTIVGSNLTRGIYLAEAIQGDNRKVVKIVKLN